MKIGKYDVKTYSNTASNFSKGPSFGSNQGSKPASPMPPRVVTNQYNSPIGLYSNNSIKEEYAK